MATEPQAAPRLEIGHVLFIDIVGYSKGLIISTKRGFPPQCRAVGDKDFICDEIRK